ncbi:MAG TPA: hypothetical protein VF627_03105, partial [Abditibacterium sp.]
MRFLLIFPVLLSAKLAFAAPLPAFEGTLSQTQNGATVRATLAWQPPDALQIEIARDDASATPAQTVLARGDETLLFEKATKRTRRYPFNIAKAWWRGAGLNSGGPANFLFAGTAAPAAGEGRFLRRDDVLFGGAGPNAYYAAVKLPARRFADAIATAIVASNATRTEKTAGQTTLSAQISLDTAGFPTATSVSAAGQKSTFRYELKPSAAPVAPAEIPRDVIEEAELLAPSAYAGTDASALFNRGAALAANEDFPAAFAAFERAGQAAPTASAPPMASFELAMAVRDDARAATALARLETLGLDPTEVLPRRARLALLRRDSASAKIALDSASAAAPQNFALRLLRADAAVSTGQIEAARALWREIVASDAALPAAQALAAQNLALYATPGEFSALLTSIPAQTDAQKLARSLLQLRGGQTPETAAFAGDALQEALALGLEAAARDEDARAAWDVLLARGDDALKNRARAHGMTLAARRGDVEASLALWRAWNATLSSPFARDAARSALLGAWQKAFRGEALGAALGNRVAGAGASEEDWRLFVAYQELYGTSDDIASALESGLARFGRSAFWLSRKAETLVAQAIAAVGGGEAGGGRRQQLFTQAMERLDEAAAAAANEPFYRFQKALAASQRGARAGGIIDPAQATRNRALAKAETDRLLADFPGDPDVLVSAALQNLTVEGDTASREALRLASAALETAPGDGDRHTLVWAARQAMATAHRRLKQRAEAAAQWEMLLLGARSGAEQSVLAASYFGFLEGGGDAAGAARLLERLAGEKWNYSASRALLDGVSGRVAASPLAPAIGAALLASDSDAAAVANAALGAKRIEVARRALESPQAPPAADANLDRATRDLGLALAKLQRVAAGANRVLAARAAAFLAENADLGGEVRLQLLQNALQIEPRDAALRLALIGALEGDAAKTEREIAARTLDFEPEVRRQLANAARRGGDLAGAAQIAEEIFAITSRSPAASANEWQRVAFALAKAAYSAGQTGRGVEIYTGLSLPQWNAIDRAAAMLARSRGAGEADKPEEVTRLEA